MLKFFSKKKAVQHEDQVTTDPNKLLAKIVCDDIKANASDKTVGFLGPSHEVSKKSQTPPLPPKRVNNSNSKESQIATSSTITHPLPVTRRTDESVPKQLTCVQPPALGVGLLQALHSLPLPLDTQQCVAATLSIEKEGKCLADYTDASGMKYDLALHSQFIRLSSDLSLNPIFFEGLLLYLFTTDQVSIPKDFVCNILPYIRLEKKGDVCAYNHGIEIEHEEPESKKQFSRRVVLVECGMKGATQIIPLYQSSGTSYDLQENLFWDRLRCGIFRPFANMEKQCDFKEHFLYYNKAHYPKYPLSCLWTPTNNLEWLIFNSAFLHPDVFFAALSLYEMGRRGDVDFSQALQLDGRDGPEEKVTPVVETVNRYIFQRMVVVNDGKLACRVQPPDSSKLKEIRDFAKFCPNGLSVLNFNRPVLAAPMLVKANWEMLLNFLKGDQKEVFVTRHKRKMMVTFFDLNGCHKGQTLVEYTKALLKNGTNTWLDFDIRQVEEGEVIKGVIHTHLRGVDGVGVQAAASTAATPLHTLLVERYRTHTRVHPQLAQGLLLVWTLLYAEGVTQVGHLNSHVLDDMELPIGLDRFLRSLIIPIPADC